MKKRLIEYLTIIKNNKKKFILINIILFIFCWIYILIPIRSILSIPLSGIKMNNINAVDVELPITKTEKNVFLKLHLLKRGFLMNVFQRETLPLMDIIKRKMI